MNSFFYLVRQGWKNIWNNRIMSLASIGVLVSCMLLIGTAALLSANISSVVAALEDQSEAIVYLKDGLTNEKIEDVRTEIIKIGKISTVDFISKEEGLSSMMKSIGDDGILFDAYKDSNNLPDSYRVTFDDVSNLEHTISQLEQIDGVISVSAMTDVAKAISGLKKIVYIGGIVIIGLLIAVSLMIIGNTIKITVFARRKEVNIMKYVGATNGFIRLPFMVEGVSLGVISGAISFILVYFAYSYISKWVAEQSSGLFSNIISEMVPFSSVSGILLGGFIGGGAFIGLFGCMIFIGKHLKV